MWDLCWTEWQWDRFFSKYIIFPLLVSFYRCSILILIFMLALPEGQTDEAWEPAKRNALSEIGQHRIEKFFQYSSHLVMDTAPGPIPHIWLWTLLLALFLTFGYGHCSWPSLSTAPLWQRCQWSILITFTRICSRAPRGAGPRHCLS